MPNGQWVGHNRSSRLPSNWQKIRQAILERDGYMCQWRTSVGICGMYANQCDHIKAMTDDHSPSGLQSLCEYHHRMKSSSEGGRAAQAKRPARRRPPEQHPGYL